MLIIVSMVLSLFSTVAFANGSTVATDNNEISICINGMYVTFNQMPFNNGKFFVTVTNIPSTNFDDVVIAKPYIVLGDETIWGQTINYTVNQGNKWLGTK